MTAVYQFVVIFLHFAAVFGESEKTKFEWTHLETVTPANFEEFVGIDGVRLIYFQEPGRSRRFLDVYDDSARLCRKYGIEMGVLQCKDEAIQEISYCQKPEFNNYLYAFRKGSELLQLSLENMFDINSIMSNTLQILLLRDVPILRTKSERLELEQENKGKKDIVFSFQHAIGTYDHRLLMEVAYSFRDDYQFALTTERSPMSDLPDAILPTTMDSFRKSKLARFSKESKGNSRVSNPEMRLEELLSREQSSEQLPASFWLLQCASATPGEPCQYMKYQDDVVAKDTAGLTRFLRHQNIDHIHVVHLHGETVPFIKYRLNFAHIYYLPDQSKEVMEVAEELVKTFRGVVGFNLVDVTRGSPSKYSYERGIVPLPGMALVLRDQHDVHYFKDDLTIMDARNFILEKLHRSGKTDDAEAKKMRDQEDEERFLGEVEQQDDSVAEAVRRLSSIPIDQTHVPKLTDKTFSEWIQSSDLHIVLYHLPFDPVSEAFMRSYAEAAFLLDKDNLHPLASVNCFDWTDVCAKNNITAYPTTRIYRPEEQVKDYLGVLDGSGVIASVKMLLSNSPLYLTTTNEVDTFLEGNLPSDMLTVTRVAVLGLFTNKNQDELAIFKSAAKLMEEKLVFGFASAEVSKQIASRYKTQAPAVVVYKRHDDLQPYRVVSIQPDMTEQDLIQAVVEASLPIFPELTTVNFPAYYSLGRPFVLLFDTDIIPGGGSHKLVSDLAIMGDFTQLIFAWMELIRKDNIAHRVLMEYNSDAEIPAISYVSHPEGLICNFPPSTLNTETLRDWLEEVVQTAPQAYCRKMPYGDWRPMNPGYDFLKMIDTETAHAKEMKEQEDSIKQKVGVSVEGYEVDPSARDGNPDDSDDADDDDSAESDVPPAVLDISEIQSQREEPNDPSRMRNVQSEMHEDQEETETIDSGRSSRLRQHDDKMEMNTKSSQPRHIEL